ncbi:transmembrane protein, putative (macronuclear) [Tetrahymena thermophila SB210]|uniref:Transmembrane protein, putative n=1 Tax=Tetrahymena thermophila (strain SB210) TaxID=312017 RepID=I7M6R1_TETTS|nr:transmembrane protein, putative [Tetrahymena thermophila SB210]EAR85668.2 transmembrane protein, putative [Tetrahymena thermophila SB210]|eukprot:XP_001033331.2 transmembrane protein, putative [Tetrahymena thermophila SB210]
MRKTKLLLMFVFSYSRTQELTKKEQIYKQINTRNIDFNFYFLIRKKENINLLNIVLICKYLERDIFSLNWQDQKQKSKLRYFQQYIIKFQKLINQKQNTKRNKVQFKKNGKLFFYPLVKQALFKQDRSFFTLYGPLCTYLIIFIFFKIKDDDEMARQAKLMEERMKKQGKKKVLLPGKSNQEKKIFDSADYYKEQEEKEKHQS